MVNTNIPRIGALTGSGVTAVVLGVMAVGGSLTRGTMSIFSELIALGYSGGPPWLGPIIAFLLVAAGGVLGAWAVAGGEYRYFSRSLVAVLCLVGTYVGWTLVWTAWRLGPSLDTTPLLPVYCALLALAGLLAPLAVLFVPAAMVWTRVIVRLVSETAR